MTASAHRSQWLTAASAVSHAVAACSADQDSQSIRPPAALSDAVQASVHAAVRSGDIPGVVAQVWRHGMLCCDVVAGVRDVNERTPLEHDTLFAIASMTKPVTVALALTLVDDGTWRLEDPITRWAPEFAQMRVLRRPDSELHDTVPAARNITLEDLMLHRSGLAYGFMTPPPLGAALMAQLGMGIESTLTPDAWLKTLAQLPLACQPGERFNYGLSIDVLGLVVARALKTSLRHAMQERILGPLKMADTDFWVTPEKRSRMASLYHSAQPGTFQPIRVAGFTSARPPEFVSGGQGLISTAQDFLRFARMLLHDGALDTVRVLQPATVRLLRSNRYTAAQCQKHLMQGRPFTSGIGLGVWVVTDPHDPAATGSEGSFGWGGAFGGWWQADPRRDQVLLWLQACAPAPPQPGSTMATVPGMAALNQFRKAVYEADDAAKGPQ